MIKQIQNELKDIKSDIVCSTNVIRIQKSILKERDAMRKDISALLDSVNYQVMTEDMIASCREFENTLIKYEIDRNERIKSINEHSALLKKALAREKQLETMLRNPFINRRKKDEHQRKDC
ncbi:hypothetical protein [Serratia marcescens]|uniref:hypothetical protein n=1 Tax=Serratia marcescens TaxID=615 RepID=UPI001F1553FD|nr:hypothetical protein [Serratia marcescens]MDP8728347.1 hypothetical protein [Serratia marcescens]